MVDRTHMFSISARETVRSVAPEIVSQGYSRIPVYDENPDQMVGILYAKDVLQSVLERDDDVPVKDLARPAMFIPETMLTDDLLREFQKEKVHIALVVDEHGGISGLITIEDLLEEIVGDIYDETDKQEIMIRKIDRNRAIVRGETEIEEVNEVLGLGLSEREDYETISGLHPRPPAAHPRGGRGTGPGQLHHPGDQGRPATDHRGGHHQHRHGSCPRPRMPLADNGQIE